MKRFFFVLLICLFLIPSPVRAATPWIFGGDFDAALQEGLSGGNNAESWVTANLGNFFPNSLNLALVGISSNTIEQAVNGEPINMKFYQQMQQRSVLGGINRGIAMIYANPPADLAYWVNDVGQTLGFIPKQAYAQGIGFSGLSALLPVWKAFRNIAYLVLAVVMIVIGFMVMLRKKIDPKTVVTVQNALPRIIVTLILITFSYAIVGFLIDLMYLLILLVVYAVGNAIPGANIPDLQAAFTAGGFWQVTRIFAPLGALLFPGIATTIAGLIAGTVVGVPAILGGLLGGPPGVLIGIIVAIAVGMGYGAITGTGQTIGALSPILLLLLFLALVVRFVQIFFILINAYIQIIVALLFGPLQIMLDAIPGGNGFSSWLSNLVINLLTFPIVIALIVLGGAISANITGPSFWSPPLVPKVPDASQFISALIGFGIIMSIPTVLNAIKEALKIKPLVPAGAGTITQPLISAGSGVLQLGSQFYYTGLLMKPIVERFKKK